MKCVPVSECKDKKKSKMVTFGSEKITIFAIPNVGVKVLLSSSEGAHYEML
jgi:hypothetical protein